MTRRTQFPPVRLFPGQSRLFTPRFLTLFLLCLAVGLGAAVVPAGAQLPPVPPPPAPLPVAVATDRPVYAPGEAVRIHIKILNPTDVQRGLTFGSTLQADYVIDGTWRWSAGKAFPALMTSVTLPPGGSFTFPDFTHTPGDYYLTPGRHEITANVGLYGQGTTSFVVGDSIPPQRQFLLSPSISPDPAPFGTPITLGVTVTNVSSQVQSFGHDGCPVHFSIDRAWKPQYLCPEYWRIETLQPGGSIEFTGADYSYMVFQNTPAFTLAPGWHSIQFEVPGVGATEARFEVTGDSRAGSISGHVHDAAGAPLQGAVVEAYPYGATDTTGSPATGVPGPWNGYQAVTDADGLYTLEQVPAGTWAVRAYSSSSGEIWYNGRPSRENADPVTVTPDAVTENVDFVLPSSPPPPPPQFDAIITGYVFDDPWPMKRASFPLPQAIVAAIPIMGGGVDSGWVPPGDSSSGGPRGSGPLPPIKPPPLPPYPIRVPGPIFYGFPDSTGLYTIRLPLGNYKVIATAPGFHYQWWERTADYDSSDDVQAHALWLDSLPPNINFALRPAPPDSAFAQVAGTVRGSDGVLPPPPILRTAADSTDVHPIAGARVVAMPLITDPRIMTLVAEMYPAETGPDGSYLIKVPVKSPYIVQASADGFGMQWYDHVYDPASATPVDVTSGQTTPHVDFDLPLYGPPPAESGVISGVVYSTDPMRERPTMPLAGAIVRARRASPGYGFETVARTDEQGRFYLFGLPIDPRDSTASGYYVSAEAPGHVPMYYPDAFQWASAQPVVPTPAGVSARRTVISLNLSVQTSHGNFFEIGYVRSESPWIGGPPIEPPMPGGGGDSTGGGDPATGGGSGGSGGGAGSSSGIGWLDGIISPGDSTTSSWPLPGAYLYLVPAEAATDGPIVPVAGSVACQNGTLVINDLAPGRYKAYADRPGFAAKWFHGTNYLDAAVIAIGEGVDPIVIDVVLTPLSAPPTPGGGREGLDAKPRIVTSLRNAPNPFRPQTTIIYRLMADADVTLDIYDVNGRLVRRMFDRLHQPAGEQHVPWDGNSADGSSAGAGIYFYRISTRAETSTGKMVMVR